MVLDEVVEFGDSHRGAVGFNQIVLAVEDEIFVSTAVLPHTVLVFTEDGRYVREFGIEGEGPSELKVVRDLQVGPDGNIWVADPANRALKVFDRSGRFVEAFHLPASMNRGGSQVLSDSTVIFNGLVATPDRVGFQLHRWHPRSGFIWSARGGNTITRRRVERLVFHADEDSRVVWVAQMNGDYVLEARDLASGRLLRRFRPNRDWFDRFIDEGAADASVAHGGIVRPAATIEDIRLIDGRLWVLGYTPARSWERAGDAGFRDLGLLLDNVIDIFDPQSGQLLLSRRIDLDATLLHEFVDDERIAGHRTLPLIDKGVLFRAYVRGPVSRN